MLGNGAGESGLFQSTRPLRGGTMMSRHPTPRASISIHPPLAGRDSGRRSPRRLRPISIHPPLTGRDKKLVQAKYTVADFNPPAPCGAGRSGRLLRRGRRDFNPPAPCGAGQVKIVHRSTLAKFQSTRPLRGGTDIYRHIIAHRKFQSTRPLRGGTGCGCISTEAEIFQSTRPLRGGTRRLRGGQDSRGISIHPPLAGRDSDLAQKNCAKHRILHKKCIYPGRIERFSGSDAAIFLPNVHKFRCEPSEESLLTPRSHAYTIRTPSG